MITETTATVVAGTLELDRRLDLPDQSRVRVAVEPLEGWQARFTAGLESWKVYCEEHPVHAGGRRYTRDELHERR
ncbi:MAG: hypothetical protein WCO26_21145 [Deltaproteobacteria bacterium]